MSDWGGSCRIWIVKRASHCTQHQNHNSSELLAGNQSVWWRVSCDVFRVQCEKCFLFYSSLVLCFISCPSSSSSSSSSLQLCPPVRQRRRLLLLLLSSTFISLGVWTGGVACLSFLLTRAYIEFLSFKSSAAPERALRSSPGSWLDGGDDVSASPRSPPMTL